MRIAIDARAYFQRTGIARYTRGLVHALVEASSRDEFLVLISDRHCAAEIAVPPHATVQVSHAPWLGADRERAVLEAEVAHWQADVFHGIFPPLVLRGTPSAATLFDVTPLTRPALHREDVRACFTHAWEGLRAAPPGSAVAVSRATRTAAARFGVVAAGEVIGIGLDATFRAPIDACRQRHGVLFVGTLEPRKHLPLLLDAAALLARRGAPIDVTVVGKSGWGDVPEAIRAHASRATFRGFVEDEALIDAYRTHAVLACPSAEEGFGLPVLEAMSQGTLPLISPAAALTELVAEDRLVVPPDPAAWADALTWWLTHDTERASLAAALQARARRHAWRAVADAWLARYAGIVARACA